MTTDGSRRQLDVFAKVALRQLWLEDPLLGMMAMSENDRAQAFLNDAFEQVTAALRQAGESTPLARVDCLWATGRHDGYYCITVLVGQAERAGESEQVALLVPAGVVDQERRSGRPFDQRPLGASLGARFFTADIGPSPGADRIHAVCEVRHDGAQRVLSVGPATTQPEEFIAAILRLIAQPGAAPS